MELHLNLALSSPTGSGQGLDLELNCYERRSSGGHNKRSSYDDEEFGGARKRSSPDPRSDPDGDVRGVPRTLPLLPQPMHEHDDDDSEISSVDHNQVWNYGSSSKYVKVAMEGVGIGRKIDLSLQHSFRTLHDTLMNMFGICDEESRGFKITYQDPEGDWVLAEDVTWRDFTESVKRLKIVKSY